MPCELADRILRDCRAAIGEVRFGFGSKRQVWAFEERHRLDVVALVEQLARDDPNALLDLALTFHDEFAAVSNSWRIRDRIQSLIAGLCGSSGVDFLAEVAAGLVDKRLAVRHWLVAAFLSAPPPVAFRGLEEALARAYQPADHWALLARLQALAQDHDWAFGPETVTILAALAQFSLRAEDRQSALDLLARFGGPAAQPILARAARAAG